MKESSFWGLLKKHLQGHADRIENTAGAGVPDVDCCLQGHSAKIELKMFKGNRIEIRDSQAVWLRRRSTLGGSLANVTYLAKKDDVIRGWKASTILSLLNTAPQTHLRGKGSVMLDPGEPDFETSKPFNWPALNAFVYRVEENSGKVPF